MSSADYPHAFKKKIAGDSLSVLSRYLVLNYWRKSNQIWCASHSHERGHSTPHFWPGPWVGVKRSNIVKFQFHRFLCHALGGGTWGSWGSNPSVCLSHYLLQNHWTKSKQIWCVSYSHEWGIQQHIVFWPCPWGPGEGSKGQISFKFNYI